MRTLLAIFSCHQYDYKHPQFVDWFKRPVADRVGAIRDTWLKDVIASGIDYKIFYGRPPAKRRIVDAHWVADKSFRQPEADEVFLQCPDDYYNSATKIRHIVNYALDNGYERLVKIDDDVYTYVERLLANLPTRWTGGGKPNTPAGPCYILRKSDLLLLRENSAPPWAEDAWVGTVLLGQNQTPVFDDRYYIAPQTQHNQYITDEALAEPNDYFTIHSLSPEQMRRHYKEELCKRLSAPTPLAIEPSAIVPSMTPSLVSLGTSVPKEESDAKDKDVSVI
jgi:hypothetical protein